MHLNVGGQPPIKEEEEEEALAVEPVSFSTMLEN